MVYYISRFEREKEFEKEKILLFLSFIPAQFSTLNAKLWTLVYTRLFEWDELKNIIVIISYGKKRKNITNIFVIFWINTILNYYCKHHVVRGQGQQVRRDKWRIFYKVVGFIAWFFIICEKWLVFSYSLYYVDCAIGWFEVVYFKFFMNQFNIFVNRINKCSRSLKE